MMKYKMELGWNSCINVDEIPHTRAFANYVNDKAYETLSTETYHDVYALCKIINKGYRLLNSEDAECLNELFPDCNAKVDMKTSKIAHRILKRFRFSEYDEYIRLFAEYMSEVNSVKIITEDISMEMILKSIAIGQHLNENKVVLIGRDGNTEININVENGNGLISELSKNGYGYDYHRPISVKELSVVITGGNLRDGEYMVRRMTPSQIYETLRDGFTVKANGFQN